MTRAEFIENINTWEELLQFADNNELYDEVSNIYTSDTLNDYVNRELYDFVREYDWIQVLNTLDNIPRYPGYFREDSWLEFEEVDDEDFDQIKEDILNAMDGYWDEEDEDEDDEESGFDEDSFPKDEEETPVEEEPFSLGELFSLCNSGLQAIRAEVNAEISEMNEAFNQFVSLNNNT